MEVREDTQEHSRRPQQRIWSGRRSGDNHQRGEAKEGKLGNSSGLFLLQDTWMNETFDATLGFEGEGPRLKASREKKQEFDSRIPQLGYSEQSHDQEESFRLMSELPKHNKTNKVRDHKRGEGAWRALQERSEVHARDMERLLVHSVTDRTALQQYLPAVKSFLHFCVETQLSVAGWDEFDVALASYLSWQCYAQDAHPSHGSMVVNGICYLFPEATRVLPRSWRSLKAWQSTTVLAQGGPVGEETVICMEHYLRELKKADATTAADMIATQLDCYLREQDLESLRVEDCVFDLSSGAVALLLGRGHRGESTKSGREQGVVVDSPFVCELVRQRCKDKQLCDKVFKLTMTKYRIFWKQAALAVLGNSEAAGPPHTLRHTGASRDLATQYRSFEQVKRRGRWKADESVQRYARPHAWFRACAGQPVAVRDKGALLLAARPARPAVAMG